MNEYFQNVFRLYLFIYFANVAVNFHSHVRAVAAFQTVSGFSLASQRAEQRSR